MAMTGGTAELVKSEKPNDKTWTIDLYVYVKEKSQDVANNQTILSLGMYVETPGNKIGSWNKTADSYIGTATSGSNYRTFNGAIPNFGGTRWLIENQDIPVTHNTDGTKTVKIYWKWGVNSSWGGYVNPSGSFDYTITPIPRKATVSSATNFTDEGNPKITFSNPGGLQLVPYVNFYNVGDENNVIYGIKRTKGTYSSPYTFSLTDDERAAIGNAFPDTKEIACWAGVETYTSSDYLGWDSKRAICTIVDANPTFTASQISCFDGNSAVVNVTGSSNLIISGKSNVKVTVTAAQGKKAATISKYQITLNGVTKELTSAGTVEFGAISGTKTVTVKVIDSRGNYTTQTKSVSVIPYRTPSVLSHPDYGLICRRCDVNGAISPSGECLKVYFKAEWSALSNYFNSPTITVNVKSSSDNKTVTLSPTTTAGTTANGYRSSATFELKVNGVSLDLTKSYEVVISCSDKFGETTQLTFRIPTAETTFHLREGGMGVGVGMYSSENKVLAIADDWTIKFNGKIVGTILGMGEVTRIDEATDFNTLVTVGVRAVQTHIDSENMENIPIHKAGVLYTYSATGKSGAASETYSYVRQEYYPLISSEGAYRYYIRTGTKSSGSWKFTQWSKFTGTEIDSAET